MKKLILSALILIFIYSALPCFAGDIEVEEKIFENSCSEAWMLWRSERYDVLWNRSALASREGYSKESFIKKMESNIYIPNSFSRIKQYGKCYTTAAFVCKKPNCVLNREVKNRIEKTVGISFYFNKEEKQLELWLGDIIQGMPSILDE